MTMTISEALCRMAKLVQSKGESFEDAQAWDVIRSRLEVQQSAIQEAVNLLGPKVPECMDCDGCKYEWEHALAALAAALGE